MEQNNPLLSYIGNPLPQYALSLGCRLLFWHGGQGSGLYAVGSTLVAGNIPDIKSMFRAHDELIHMRAYANYPECITEKSQNECYWLAKQLERLGRRLYGKAFSAELEEGVWSYPGRGQGNRSQSKWASASPGL